MILTIKVTVTGMVIITVKGMLRITVKDMVNINGKYMVRCMVIIIFTGTVTHSYLYQLCASVLFLHPPLTGLPTDGISTRTCLDMSA